MLVQTVMSIVKCWLDATITFTALPTPNHKAAVNAKKKKILKKGLAIWRGV